MATDFFTRQDAARRNTGRLVLLFVLAVLFITLGIYAAFYLAEWILGSTSVGGSSVDYDPRRNGAIPPVWNATRFLLTLFVVVVVVGGAALFKTSRYRSGGGEVARSVGGRRVDAGTRDPLERRLLNVVEEMAIASGTPVPEVYLLEQEEGINAFAAGYSPDDAAVAVTKGCLETLSRDELQGVVAHEFSHILNGDMRLNIRLGGLIFGIFVLWILGQAVMRASFYGNAGRRNRDSGRAGLALVVVGLAFLLLGLLGQFFGRLIQAAISRQREFLADASAVQFTRNPSGIADALKKIGGGQSGSAMASAEASALAHAFFSNAYKAKMAGALATHPPLSERIRAVQPDWDGKFLRPVRQTARFMREPEKPKRQKPADPGFPFLGRAGTDGGGDAALGRLALLLGAVGSITPETVRQTRETMASLPDELRHGLTDPFSCLASIVCLFLDSDAAARAEQLELIPAHLEQDMLGEVQRLYPAVNGLARADRLPVLELAVNGLRKISESEYQHIMDLLRALVQADEKTTLFEFVLLTIVDFRLGRMFRPAASRRESSASLGPFVPSVSRLLSLLAHLEQKTETGAREAFAAGAGEMKGGSALQYVPSDRIRFQQLFEDLEHLRGTSFALRKDILKGVLRIAFFDENVSASEAEVARALSIALDCPMPPLSVAGASASA